MSDESMLMGKIVDERNRCNDSRNRDIEVVDRYKDRGSIISGVNPISASKG